MSSPTSCSPTASGDEHQDHRTIAEFTWNTFRNHLIAEYEIPKYEGDLGHPNLFVPLSEQLAVRKVELLMQHFGTQRNKGWFRPETFRGLMALRGVECASAIGLGRSVPRSQDRAMTSSQGPTPWRRGNE